MAESLYRKYRPQIFEDVVGQEHIERTLKNAIEQDKVSHAYLFCGPRGTGKTTTARLLAKALLCEKGPTPDPDGTCEDCVMIANGEHPDVYELDAASRTGVDNVREEIIGRVQYAPTRGRYKVYIIDEVHMLTIAAFNALLKTLEEPPEHVVFILATTDPQKVPETIHSRCQRFDFRRISNEALVSRLGAVCVAEGVEFEGEALELIAHRSDGGMRNALTSLEQVIAFSEGAVTLENTERLLGSMDASDLGEIVGAIGRRDVATCFRWTAEFVETGADLARFTRDLAVHVRNLYVMTLAGADVALEVGASERREMEAELPLFAPDRLARLLGILGDLTNELKTSTNPRLSFEIALTRMVRPDADLTMESLAERVEALEAGYSAVAHVSSAPAPAAAQPAQGGTQQTVRPAQQAAAAGAQAASQGGAAYAAQPAQRQERAEQAAAQPDSWDQGAQPREQRPAEPQPTQQAGRSAAQAGGAASAAASAAQPQTAAAEPAPVAASAGAGASAVSAQLAASLSNPASLQRVWQAALSTLKKEKAAYGVLFLNTKAVFDAAAGALTIEFPAENTFAFKAVQKPDVQNAVASALVRACGEQVAFSYAQAGSRIPAGASAGAGAASGSTVASEPSAAGEPGDAAAAARAVAAYAGSARRETGAASRPVREEQRGGFASAQPVAGAARDNGAGQGFAAREPQPAASEPRPSGGFAQEPSAPAYDAVPYDDDAVPYDDAAAMSYDVPPWEEPAPARPRAEQPQARPASTHPSEGWEPERPREQAGAPSQAAAQPQAQAAAQPRAAQSRAEQATPLPAEPGASQARDAAPASAPDDLQAILAAGFGDGVTFQEVRE